MLDGEADEARNGIARVNDGVTITIVFCKLVRPKTNAILKNVFTMHAQFHQWMCRFRLHAPLAGVARQLG